MVWIKFVPKLGLIMMKLCFIFIGFIHSVTSIGQPSANVKAFAPEELRMQMMTKSDVLMLDKLLCDNLLYIHSNAVEEDKALHLANIASGKIRYRTMDIEQTAYFTKGKFTFTNGILRVNGVYDSKDFDIRLKYTAVYQKQKCRWKLLRWQSTKINN